MNRLVRTLFPLDDLLDVNVCDNWSIVIYYIWQALSFVWVNVFMFTEESEDKKKQIFKSLTVYTNRRDKTED